MRANRVPTVTRILNQLRLLRALDDAFVYYDGEFYPKCRYCDATNIQVSMSGHRGGKYACRARGVEKRIAHYERLLRAESVYRDLLAIGFPKGRETHNVAFAVAGGS